MPLNAHDLSVGVFLRGLSNLKTQLAKAEEHASAIGSGESALLGAKLATQVPGVASSPPNDLHAYTLAAQVHWAAECARLAIARLLDTPAIPTAHDAQSFAGLHQRLDATIGYLREVAPGDLEAGLDRVIVSESRHGSTRCSGGQFLIAYAIPHFFYHVTAAYGILRNQGVPLRMGDFLGSWETPLQ